LEIEPQDDKSLLAAIASGDEEAFRSLVTQYQNRVFNTCLGLLQQRQDAEDVTQEVFIKVFNSAGEFRGEAKLTTWLYRIATTACLDLLRSRQRKKRFAFVQSIFGMQGDDEIGDDSGFCHPGMALENQERATVLFKALAGLSANQRTAFTLHKVEGLSYQEIGEVLKLSIPSVESLMHRAKQNLRASLSKYYEDAD
jgi:RNA polymerase sigma factor (sigma-70 family)